MQNLTDEAIGSHFCERGGVRGSQCAVLFAHAEARHAVSTTVDDLWRRRNAPKRLEIVRRICLDEFQIHEVVLKNRLQSALIKALQFLDFSLERRRRYADAA